MLVRARFLLLPRAARSRLPERAVENAAEPVVGRFGLRWRNAAPTSPAPTGG